jgi:mannose-6-phosphate isomerase
VPAQLQDLWQRALNGLSRLVPDYPARRKQRNLESEQPALADQRREPMNNEIYPLQFAPTFKDYPWGGRNLERVLGRTIPDGVVAESWDISAHPNGQTTVANGPLQGLTLQEVQEKLGQDLVGSRNQRALELGKFPLLIKLLDANRWLSVQVHPDDAYALANEGEYGKTEMWVVLHAEPGAEIIYGLKQGVDREAFQQAVAEDRSLDLLHRITVAPGAVIFVPAGAVHALGPGVIVAEIQQNSDTTYRIYDWGRMGNDGKPRPLHVEQALAVIDWTQVEPGPVTPRLLSHGSRGIHQEVIAESEYFRTERFHLSPGSSYRDRCAGESFQIWGVMAGRATVEWDGEPITLEPLSWVLLPAALGNFQVKAEAESTLLRVLTPEVRA